MPSISLHETTEALQVISLSADSRMSFNLCPNFILEHVGHAESILIYQKSSSFAIAAQRGALLKNRRGNEQVPIARMRTEKQLQNETLPIGQADSQQTGTGEFVLPR